MDETSEEYDRAIRPCHKRAAERMLVGCLQNGGLYVKLGQGMVSMNHILPREYVDTLVVLQDKALPKKPHEVIPASVHQSDSLVPAFISSLSYLYTNIVYSVTSRFHHRPRLQIRPNIEVSMITFK